MAPDSKQDLLATAAARLYSAVPEEFMSLRASLSKSAKDAGDAAAGRAISNLRKPTLAASVVNRLAHHDPDAVARLTTLGDKLRIAHDAFDATLLRELSGERRAVVAELVDAAFAFAGQRDPSTAVRDDVSATFDAAVADPDVADRLGRLTKPERFSGFGVELTASPDLTVLRGGKDAAGSAAPEVADTVPAATRRRLARALDKARTAFDDAESHLSDAQTQEQEAAERIRALAAEIAELQSDLDTAKRDLDQLRRAVKSARVKRREARSALDRAQRQAPD